MGKYDTARLRNFGVVAHGGAGKTSLVEAMLFCSGVTDRLGRVDDGSSLLDHQPEEVKRTSSIDAGSCCLSWKEHELNILDTPGYANFLHDTRNCLRVVDGLVLLASAISGVKSQTQKIWEWGRQRHLPAVAFVSKMDRERANFSNAVASMAEALSIRAVPLVLPIGAESDFRGVIDLVAMKAYFFADDTSGRMEEADIPEELREEAQIQRIALVEAAAETDEVLMEKYLEEDDLGEEEIRIGLRAATLAGDIVPVMCGSGPANRGVGLLLDAVTMCLPSPADRPAAIGVDPKSEEMDERPNASDAPFSALVFKTISDPYTGKLNLMRVYSGVLKSDSTIFNAARDCAERIGQLFKMVGKKQIAVDQAMPGEFVAVAKLKETVTGDTLCDGSHPIRLDFPAPLKPVISFALEAHSKNDEDKIHSALQRLVEEDPTLQLLRDEETHELILSGMGQIHVEVTVEKLKRKFNVEVDLREPKVPYRETLRGSAKLQSKYKKQSGGRGQYADVWLEFSPLGRGEGFQFEDKIVGGAVPRQYIPAVEKGIAEAARSGVLAGFPTVDFKATLFDGSFHTVDSSEMAFKIAGSMGFKKGAEMASPVLLEPIMKMEISVPDECVGDVIGDMNSRRGKVLGMDPKGGIQQINVMVPLAEVLKYSPELRSMTSDRGMFTMEFSHYEEVPGHLTGKLLAELKREV
ncbi:MULTISPECIES: elongation factor G [Syntrophotalea]|uniref:Elongation factor G n=1 Tax=Syntrophotalea acetylenica TaxID=29542 RepID=A0A1L3GJM5_SYNAC|nr:elongation factor G [Syntrophotalea acetylenica]APG26090.1 translation elongation factor G [Syntrophotalea acetylenica]APG44156.1 elongation factor G [Syntrophotalea acetylenica]MDY0261169.1 elongation factor G [Syntrophotalea acetylenica]